MKLSSFVINQKKKKPQGLWDVKGTLMQIWKSHYMLGSI